jgi:hypothetical protein
MHRFRHAARRRPGGGLRRAMTRGRGSFAHRWRSSLVRLAVLALSAGAVGATLEFLFDPRSGRRRRAQVRDRAAGAVRRRRRQLGRNAHREAGKVVGLATRSRVATARRWSSTTSASCARSKASCSATAASPRGRSASTATAGSSFCAASSRTSGRSVGSSTRPAGSQASARSRTCSTRRGHRHHPATRTDPDARRGLRRRRAGTWQESRDGRSLTVTALGPRRA